jgi:hypothetical protein
VTGELRAALERVLRRARGVEERAAARELHRLLESLDLFTRGATAPAINVSAPAATVPKLAPRTARKATPHGPRTMSATRNGFIRALHGFGFGVVQIRALTFGDVSSAGAQFHVQRAGGVPVTLAGEAATVLRDLLRWGWEATIDGGAKPDPTWPLVPAKPGATEPPTLRQLQHAVAGKSVRNTPPAAA